MSEPLFAQTVIAVIWDFDKTLIDGYMQEPLFRHYGVEASQFWDEVNRLPEEYARRGACRTSRDSVYLNHILTYVRRGVFRGLSNALLRKLGSELRPCPGVLDFLAELKALPGCDPRHARHEIRLEHYVVSTGLRAMIEGTPIASCVDDIWGCEFVQGSPDPGFLEPSPEQPPVAAPVITDIAYAIDNTTKTRAIFEINKGTNKDARIDVNSWVAASDRRVPFEHMIYVADGPSDIPVFSVLKKYGGRTYGVYSPGSEAAFRQLNSLHQQGRIDCCGPADYSQGSQSRLWLRTAVLEICDRIARVRDRALAERVALPPQHIHD